MFTKICRTFLTAGILIMPFACTAPPDQLGSLDLKQWREDKRGCGSVRKDLVPDLDLLLPELLGKDANDIGRLFGKPDVQQLGDRNQKTYVYFLEDGPQCRHIHAASEVRKAVFRFNAVGLLTELTYQRELTD